MIEITIAPGRIAAAGHADDGAGCAAVSGLLYALAGGLENIGGSPSWFVQDGEAEIEIGGGAQAQAMRLMAEVGLRQIAAAREDIRIVDSTAGPRQRRQNDGSGGTCYAERDRFAGKERFS